MTLSPQLARLFDEAQDLHQAGRLADAKARYDRILAADPRHGPTLHMVGLMAYQVGQNDLAVDILSRAAQRADATAALHSNLGLALRAQGKVAEAAASFRRALAINPDAAETHSNLGNVLMEQGHVAAAANAYGRAVALNPGLAALHANLGDALWAQGKLAEAEASHNQALALEPGNADTLKSLALLALARGDAGLAMRRIHDAVLRDDSPRSHRIFADIVQGLSWESDDEGVRALLTRAIDEGWSRPAVFAGTALGLIRQRQAGGGRLQDDGLLRALLRAVPNSDVTLERDLTALRRALLLAGGGTDDFSLALAQQCFLNEYVWSVAADEAEAVAALQAKAALSAAELVALACYAPLGALPADRIAAAPPVLLAQQRDEPAAEKRLAEAMPALTPIADDVSRAVAAMYEENPYPRWARLQEAIPPVRLGHFLASRFPYAALAQADIPERPDVLVAGCGTGQYALELAREFAVASVLAVDLSRASLGHAARKAAEAGVTTIRFGQADILQIGALERRFGFIECSGVLHHMADPFAGWRALLECLNPGGLMLAAFYSATARTAIAEVRDWIRREGYPATPDGIRAARARLMENDPQGRLRTILTSPDFCTTSACRDLLFHVQEHTLTLEQIAAFLSANGLTFIGMEVSETIRSLYRSRFPDDPAAASLENWAALERDHPDIFAAMYQFWVQKK
jgi:Tfp pilus assembly protein PilF/SAM-dependent methyltransferase